MTSIAVLGAGNGGQGLAGYLAMSGHDVRLFDRNAEKIEALRKTGTIRLTGAISGVGLPACISTDLSECLRGAEYIMVATTADAHRVLAQQLTPYLSDGQTIVLNPGRTLGAVEVRHVLDERGVCRSVCIVEAQTLAFACRTESIGNVRIMGMKKRVLVAGYPKEHTTLAVQSVCHLMPCFAPAASVLETSLENIGAIFHPAIVLLNAATIERGVEFLFYNEMTAGVARVVEALDRERLAIGAAYGVKLKSAEEWVSYAYDIPGDSGLCARMRSNPAYSHIAAPTALATRYLLEDIPTGLVPMIELARAAGVETPIMQAIVALSQTLIGRDLTAAGRTLQRVGLGGLRADQIRSRLR